VRPAVENGQSVEGGAILDDGASLTLRSDAFSIDMSVSAPTTVIGAAAPGGALAVLAGSTDSMNVTVTDCQFSNDAATGGAVYVAADHTSSAHFSCSKDTISDCMAPGGASPGTPGANGHS
jgi:hypothetical protein